VYRYRKPVFGEMPGAVDEFTLMNIAALPAGFSIHEVAELPFRNELVPFWFP
jgi:hypothetical protein